MMRDGAPDSQGNKRKAEEMEEAEKEPDDNVRLWEDGWKDRYYTNKFDIDSSDVAFRQNVVRKLLISLHIR